MNWRKTINAKTGRAIAVNLDHVLALEEVEDGTLIILGIDEVYTPVDESFDDVWETFLRWIQNADREWLEDK